jgi:CBS domain-containing protein
MRVQDIMETDVITLPPNAPVSDLLTVLERSRISGAPVVDEQEVLVGVATMRDILRLARDIEDVPEAGRWGPGAGASPTRGSYVDSGTEGEFFAYYVTPTGGFVDLREQIRELPGDLFEGFKVEDIMTRVPVTIEPDATIPELARLLRERGIHRVLVAASGKLLGIVSTMDVMKVIAAE